MQRQRMCLYYTISTTPLPITPLPTILHHHPVYILHCCSGFTSQTGSLFPAVHIVSEAYVSLGAVVEGGNLVLQCRGINRPTIYTAPGMSALQGHHRDLDTPQTGGGRPPPYIGAPGALPGAPS